jgi:apolipoprotein N-acyltransferase
VTKNDSTPKSPGTRIPGFCVPFLVGLAHSALMLASAPPLNLWPLVFVALLPLAWLVRRPYTRPWRDALLVMVGALPLWGVWEWWTSEVTGLGYIPFICVQSLWTGVFLLIARRLCARFRLPLSLVVPVVWTAVEYLRGELFLDGYAWGLLAHPLITVTALASPAALLGTYFVSFLAAMVNGALADWLFEKRPNPAMVGIGIGAAAWIVGALTLPPIDGAAPRVTPAVVQTNVAQSNKLAWSPERELTDWKEFQNWTREAAGGGRAGRRPDFIVWPETMVPGLTIEPEAVAELRRKGVFFRSDESDRRIDAGAFADSLNQLQAEVGLPMLVGAIARVGFTVAEDSHGGVRFDQRSKFNSVYLISSGAVRGDRYDKVRLTPFGETMPYIRFWPWLQDRMLQFGANGMKFDLDFGKHLTAFSVPAASLGRDVRVVTPICFEITIANHTRALVFEHGRRRADLIAGITNDGWFGRCDIAREQHLQAARWRAIELATPVVRAANTGASALIDARGRVLARGVENNPHGSQVDGILMGEVPLGTRTTLYARVGDILPWTMLGIVSIALLASLVRRNTPRLADPHSAAQSGDRR